MTAALGSRSRSDSLGARLNRPANKETEPMNLDVLYSPIHIALLGVIVVGAVLIGAI